MLLPVTSEKQVDRVATGLTVKPTTCYMCTYDCPANAYLDAEGRIVKVEGQLCPRGQHQLDLQYHPERLLYPLIREQGTLRQVSWEEALDRIATALLTIRAVYGPVSVLFYAGYPKEGRPWLQRLAYLFGSPHYLTESSFCFSATYVAGALNYGPEYGWFLSSGRSHFAGTRCHLLWTSNPATSAAPNVYEEFLAARRRGMKLIVVDPRRTEIAQTADWHLQLRPGTDGALALGLLHVILGEDLYDHEFATRWTVGFDGLQALVAQYPPDRVAAISGVPTATIRAAARLYACSKPAKVQISPCATVHTTNGVQNHRAILLLPALTGNLDVPGGNRLPPPSAPTNDITLFAEKISQLKPRAGSAAFPVWSRFYPEDQANAIVEQMLTGKPYPFKALIGVGANRMIWPNSERAKTALRQLDFVAVIDYFHTPTTELAQVILPAATWLERSALISRPGGFVRLREPVVEPLGAAWPDWKFLMELGKRLGFGDQFWNGDLTACLNHILQPSGVTVAQLRAHPEGIRVPVPQRPVTSYEQRGFSTPSGRVEIHSSILEAHGYDPLPVYREPAESPIATPELAARFPLVLTTGGRSKAYTHSQFRNLPALRRLMPEPLVQIHPRDALARGISHGDWVVVRSKRGQIRVKAALTETLKPGVVHLYHGWAQANANLLTNDQGLDPISGFAPYKSGLCQVEREMG